MKRWTTVPHENWSRSRELRRQSTPAEAALWSALKGKQLGVKFRCQHPFGPYIVDFYCDELRLVIELDGEIHGIEETKARDSVREEYLKSRQRVVVRFTNQEVLEHPEKVLDNLRKIIATLKADLPLDPP